MHNLSTFREIAELWKENRRSVVKHSTYCAYALILKTHIMPVFADSVSISEAEVQQFAFGKLETGLSKKTVHDIIAVLKSVGRFGAKRGMFEMPSWDIEYPSDTAARVLPVLSLPDHKKLLNAIASAPTLQNIGIMIALCCGLRIGEVCRHPWNTIDGISSRLRIRLKVSRYVRGSFALDPSPTTYFSTLCCFFTTFKALKRSGEMGISRFEFRVLGVETYCSVTIRSQL